jgi:Flp pilus assembly protein TadG
MRRQQAGLTIVEFALVGPIAFLVLLGCIEIGRALFVWNTIGEATRRAARVAVVSATDGAAAKLAAEAYGTSYLDQLNKDANVTVTYIGTDGAAVVPPAEPAFVTVQITGLTHSLIIPFVGRTITLPAFTTTLPVESMGTVPP